MQPWYPVSESDAEDDFIRLNCSNEECFRALLAQKVRYSTSIHLIRPAWEHCRLVFMKSDRVGHTEYIGPWTTLARPSGAGPPYTQPPYQAWTIWPASPPSENGATCRAQRRWARQSDPVPAAQDRLPAPGLWWVFERICVFFRTHFTDICTYFEAICTHAHNCTHFEIACKYLHIIAF